MTFRPVGLHQSLGCYAEVKETYTVLSLLQTCIIRTTVTTNKTGFVSVKFSFPKTKVLCLQYIKNAMHFCTAHLLTFPKKIQQDCCHSSSLQNMHALSLLVCITTLTKITITSMYPDIHTCTGTYIYMYTYFCFF